MAIYYQMEFMSEFPEQNNDDVTHRGPPEVSKVGPSSAEALHGPQVQPGGW